MNIKHPVTAAYGIYATSAAHLLLIGLHIEADFVPRVQMDISLHVIRSICKVKYFLWKDTTNIKKKKQKNPHLITRTM